MKIYIALCKDRHMDEVVKVFKKADAAIDFAKQFVEENKSVLANIEEEEIEGWLYYATYSYEGDSVRVEEGTLE